MSKAVHIYVLAFVASFDEAGRFTIMAPAGRVVRAELFAETKSQNDGNPLFSLVVRIFVEVKYGSDRYPRFFVCGHEHISYRDDDTLIDVMPGEHNWLLIETEGDLEND